MARSGFKMKGSPMQRNFGIGASPMRDEKVVKGKTYDTVEVSGGKGGKTKRQRDYEATIEKLASREYDREIAFREGGAPGDYFKLSKDDQVRYKAKAQRRLDEKK